MSDRNKINKKHLLYLLLVISIGFNVAVLYYDTIPYLYPKVKNKYFRDKTISVIDENTESTIINNSINTISFSKTVMPWSEPKGFTSTVFNLNHISSSNEFRIYNYPKAFFFYGYSEYLIKNNKDKELSYFKSMFDKFMDFEITRIDQVPFGLVALNLFEKYNEQQYIGFASKLYSYIIESIEIDNMVSYRKGSKIVLNDMLGMVVPFLIEYSRISKNDEAMMIAQNQISYYVKFGIDKETYLPTHAIDTRSKVKVGPTNWGRGIGWYFIALSHLYKATGEFEEEYYGLISTLSKLKNSEGLWGQFPGSNDRFDASATTMILYSIALNNSDNYTKQQILKMLKDYINTDGRIMNTSGDTYGVNHYSHTFGYSELSQGMLLMLLGILD